MTRGVDRIGDSTTGFQEPVRSAECLAKQNTSTAGREPVGPSASVK